MKKLHNVKWFILGAVSFALITAFAVSALATTGTRRLEELYFRDITITLDGDVAVPKNAHGDVVEPFIIDGSTFLPLRGIAELLGLEVDWNDEASTVVLETPEPGYHGLVVFWSRDPRGEVIHLSGSCHTLRVRPFSGRIEDAVELGRYRWCNVCSLGLEDIFPVRHLAKNDNETTDEDY